MDKLQSDNSLSAITSALGAKPISRTEWRCACPVHGGSRKDAFSIKQKDDGTLLFHCFAGCNQSAVFDYFRDKNLLPAFEGQSLRQPGPRKSWRGGYTLKVSYPYAGGFVGRYEDARGDKIVIPYFRNGGYSPGYVKGEHARQIYNAECIAEHEEIFIVEGEKCVEACKAIGIPNVITWPGGCKQVDLAEWSQIAGKKVFIWPDNDEAGKKAAEVLKAICQKNNCTVKISDIPPGLKDGGDVADCIESGMPQSEILKIFHSAARPLGSFTASEFMAMDIQPRKNICGFVFRESISMVYAWRGVGKTIFGMSLAYAISTGRDFLKWETSEAARVLYLDGEMPGTTMHSRMHSIRNMNDGVIPMGPNFVMCGHYSNREFGLPKLSDVAGRQRITDLIEENDSEVIFIDNLSSFVSGDENDSEHWDAIQDWMIEQRSKGRAIVFFHHASKSGGQRGTSKREDCPDFTIALRAPAFEETEPRPTLACFEWHLEKMREEIDSDPFVAWVERVPRGLHTHWRQCSMLDHKKERCFRLRDSKFSMRNIAAALNLNQDVVKKWLESRAEGPDAPAGLAGQVEKSSVSSEFPSMKFPADYF